MSYIAVRDIQVGILKQKTQQKGKQKKQNNNWQKQK